MLVEGRQQNRVEVNAPDAVVGFFEDAEHRHLRLVFGKQAEAIGLNTWRNRDSLPIVAVGQLIAAAHVCALTYVAKMSPMTRRSRFWLVAASLFTFINIVGAGMAVAGGEGAHTGAHVVLLVVGAYVVWRLAPRPQRQHLEGAPQTDERLQHLHQSVDAIALEVERIGEAQRYIAKRAAERAEPSPLKPDP